MQTNHSPSSQQATTSAPIQQVLVGAGKRDSLLWGFALGTAFALAIVSMLMSWRAQSEARMLQYYVNEVDGKLIHAGFIEPRERWSPSWQPAPRLPDPKPEKQP